MTHYDLNGHETVPMIIHFFGVKLETRNISYGVWNLFLDLDLFYSFSLSTLYGQQNCAVCLSVFINCLYFGILLYIIAVYRTVLTNQTDTVPPIEKNVYLLRKKICARFGLNFSILLLCQMKIQDEKKY